MVRYTWPDVQEERRRKVGGNGDKTQIGKEQKAVAWTLHWYSFCLSARKTSFYWETRFLVSFCDNMYFFRNSSNVTLTQSDALSISIASTLCTEIGYHSIKINLYEIIIIGKHLLKLFLQIERSKHFLWFIWVLKGQIYWDDTVFTALAFRNQVVKSQWPYPLQNILSYSCKHNAPNFLKEFGFSSVIKGS